MKLDFTEQQTVREYLLGQASQEDSSRVEDRLLTDSAFYEELLITEDELIEQYLSDNLAQPERQSFETHFLLAPGRQQQLRFARTLHKYVDFAGTSELQEHSAAESLSAAEPAIAKPPAKRSFFSFLPMTNPIVSYSLAAAILLTVGGVSWLIFNNWRQQTEHQPGNVYVVTLTPGLTRDRGEIKRIAIPPGTNTVQLRLTLPIEEYQSYRAELFTSDRVTVWAKEHLKSEPQASEKFVTLSIPATTLKRDDYQVKVSGWRTDGSYEDVSRYLFRVVQ